MANGAVDDKQTSNAARKKAAGLVYIWDLPTRLFHWALVVCVAVAWWTGGSGEAIHEILGYTIAGLLAFRIFWGIAGTKYAKFISFLYTPLHVYRYFVGMFSGKAERYLGHNPAGGSMIFALILALVALISTGVMMHTITFFGVLWVEKTHEYVSDLLLIMILLHVLGVLVSSLAHGENLLLAMFTGYKKLLPQAGPGGLQAEDAALDVFDRIRSAEGFTVLIIAVLIGGAYGWSKTSSHVTTFIDMQPEKQTAAAAQFENKAFPSLAVNAPKSSEADTMDIQYPAVEPKLCIIHLCTRNIQDR